MHGLTCTYALVAAAALLSSLDRGDLQMMLTGVA
jgi:hypothetical protein